MSPPAMIALVPFLTTNCHVRQLRISVPLVPALVDNRRYWLPDALPPPAGEELRPMLRPKITQPMRAPRAPSLKTLVRYALKCQSAEQLGEKLKKRFDRQRARRGIKTGPTAAELERLLGR